MKRFQPGRDALPPGLFLKFFRWYCHPGMLDYIEGDLMEVYRDRLNKKGKGKADMKFIMDVLLLCRPGIIRPMEGYKSLNNYGMIKSYFRVGWRNLLRNKGYSLINIGGLAVGMAVATLIGLWIYDELSFDKSVKNYDRIAQVMQHNTVNGVIETGVALPVPLANELRTTYGEDFKYVLLSSWTEGHTLSIGEKKFWKTGNYIEQDGPEMLSLKIIHGSRDGLRDPNSIMISASMAKAFMGDDNPLGKVLLIDNQVPVKVTAVYEDLPRNSQFSNLDYLAPWKLNVAIRDWVKNSEHNWLNNSFQIFVQLADHADIARVSEKIKNAKLASQNSDIAKTDPRVFLQPMSRWHLFSEFKDGVNAGGRIQFVWLFATIGTFVLLLACINFMNLSTARSEKRAKEVGIRKAIGSVNVQLIVQFLSESLLVVFLAFIFSLLLVSLFLPWFNEIADKEMTLPWTNPIFWLMGIGFSIVTGLIAGSYPALYLSSFQPIKVLKGTFRVGRFASLPRKVLVVVQFTVSIALIIGTVVVFLQIQYAKDRPIGYSRNGLIYIQTMTPEIHNHFEAVRDEFIGSGAVVEIAESESPLTAIWNNNGGFEWAGKDADQIGDFAVVGVTHEFGKTIGWDFTEGRDFSRSISSDSTAMVLNEAAVRFMGLKNPVGEIITEPAGNGTFLHYKIIGVIKDMIMNSPYDPAKQTLFYLSKYPSNFVNIKINPAMSATEAVEKIGAIFRKYDPSSLFDYKFANEEFAKKFATESRIGKLASFFTILAIFISCLGLFGLASFVAEQRTKEIGIRKVMGASVSTLWRMLSTDFVVLVVISCLIAIPIAWYFMYQWLQTYQYHTGISMWIFLATGAGALFITLLTVSYQAVKAAMINPVKSLRSE